MIDLADGLSFEEALEVAKWLRADKILKQDLHDELQAGVNSMLTILTTLQGVPWLLNFLPGNLGAQLGSAVKALQLMKGFLEA